MPKSLGASAFLFLRNDSSQTPQHNRRKVQIRDETMIELTKITTTKPQILSKSFRLKDNGELQKIQGGALVEGMAEKLEIPSVIELAELLTRLSPVNALVYGITEHERARVVTKKALANITDNGGDPVVARTREHFKFPEDEGILMLDGDFPKNQEPMTGEQYMQALYRVCPTIETAPHILAASASTFVFRGKKCLKGPNGWRVLVAVQNAKDIPRAGSVFSKRCWLNDFGYIFISKSGATLPRSIVDTAVWQPERLDFCGGAHCISPLEQRKPAPKVYNPDAKPLDTMEVLRGLSHADEDKVLHAKAAAISEARPESEEARRVWVSERAKTALIGTDPGEYESEKLRLTDVYTRAAKNKILYGDFVLTLADEKQITVGEILDQPGTYHGTRCADPLEPDYNNDHRIGWINLRAGGRSFIYSHAHGGQRFTLHRPEKLCRLLPGNVTRLSEKS